MTERLQALASSIPSDLDAVLITSGFNRRYYTGFGSSAGTLLVTKEKSYFLIDMRYFEAASAKIAGCEVILQKKLYPQLQTLLEKHGVRYLGLESQTTSLSEYARLQKKLENVNLVGDDRVSEIIAKQRSRKSADELNSMAAAQKIADKTFTHILNFIKPGKTEREIALEMEYYSLCQGSEEAAFSFIIASGPNSAKPHAVPGERPVQAGDFLVMDYGATIHGYRSDMTRTIAVGHVSDKQKEVYELVLRANKESLQAVRAGVVCKEVDKIARDIIDATAYKGLFGHGLGHSVGLEIHEDPRFNTECETVLEEGMVMTVEPGIYIPGEFGVRIEDMIVATETGCRNFATSEKELIVL